LVIDGAGAANYADVASGRPSLQRAHPRGATGAGHCAHCAEPYLTSNCRRHRRL